MPRGVPPGQGGAHARPPRARGTSSSRAPPARSFARATLLCCPSSRTTGRLKRSTARARSPSRSAIRRRHARAPRISSRRSRRCSTTPLAQPLDASGGGHAPGPDSRSRTGPGTSSGSAASSWPRSGSRTVALEVDAPVVPGAPAAAAPARSDVARPEPGLPVALGLAFLGGLVLNLMPCVLPVLSLKVLGFVRHAGEGRTSVAARCRLHHRVSSSPSGRSRASSWRCARRASRWAGDSSSSLRPSSSSCPRSSSSSA